MPEKEISLAPLPFFNPRRKVLLIIFSGLFILIAVCLWGFFMNPELYGPNYAAKRLSPSLVHLFGTDQLGRDMFYRTISGLSLSIQIGLLSAVLSSFIALVLGSMSAIYGGKVDYIINYLVDLCMGVPHLILLILISIACNGGASGVAIKLYEHDRSTAVSLGKTSAKQTVTPGTSGGTGSADLEFYADYISTAATVTAGKADGTANFNMIYN